MHISFSTKPTLICVYDNELNYFELILNLDFKLATHVIVDFDDFGPIIILDKVKYFKHIVAHNINLCPYKIHFYFFTTNISKQPHTHDTIFDILLHLVVPTYTTNINK